MKKGEHLKYQLKVKEFYISLWNTRILSGAYKLRETQKSINGKWVDCSNEEKLKDHLMIMKNHIEQYQEMVDELAKIKE